MRKHWAFTSTVRPPCLNPSLSRSHFPLLVAFTDGSFQHGRIAMLAIVGLIVPEFVRVPGEIYQTVSVLDAHNAMVSAALTVPRHHKFWRLGFNTFKSGFCCSRLRFKFLSCKNNVFISADQHMFWNDRLIKSVEKIPQIFLTLDTNFLSV